MRCPFRLLLVVLASLTLLSQGRSAARADEGMWLFNAPPKKLLEAKYQFTPTDAWLDHVRLAAVRFNDGGSGSFVSGDGLVMTNHHVGAHALQQLSTKDRDLTSASFYARTRAEELKCPDSELNVLMSLEDVTARVTAAVTAEPGSPEAQRQHRAVMNTIEQESLDKTGLRSDVVTLYHGGLYHLYRYKKYTDVRLVFAPEAAIAFFGGDADNFEYPRYDLDICFFRVYEDGKPATTVNHLAWNPAALKEGDLVFVAGNPGRTDRQDTVRHLEYIRDHTLPESLDLLRRHEVLLESFGQRNAENARRVATMVHRAQNGRKARLGMLAGLQDPAVMARKSAEQAMLRAVAEKEPARKAAYDKAMTTIDQSLAAMLAIRDDYELIERGQGFSCQLFGIARTLVRMAEELPKPNADRLREYRESNLESLRQDLFSDAPIYDDVQTQLLADSLSLLIERKGGADPLVREVLAGKSPAARAAELVRGTKLADVAVRRRLAEGGAAAIAASDDPMIRLVRLVDAPARKVRASFEQKVEEPQRWAYGELAAIRFAGFGTNIYPDATFTLRLALGVVKACRENGEAAPVWTTLGGAYRHAEAHGSAPPFALPQSWLDHKDRLDLNTPFNFVFTADIIGGNSGSPVINRAGELVGIVFDGNLGSLVWDFVYTDDGRAVAVHGSAILETLRKVYDAGPLADELARNANGAL